MMGLTLFCILTFGRDCYDVCSMLESAATAKPIASSPWSRRQSRLGHSHLHHNRAHDLYEASSLACTSRHSVLSYDTQHCIAAAISCVVIESRLPWSVSLFRPTPRPTPHFTSYIGQILIDTLKVLWRCLQG
jgi:hypothetical protein